MGIAAWQHGSMAGRTFVLRTGMTNTGRGKRTSTWASLSDAVDIDVDIDRYLDQAPVKPHTRIFSSLVRVLCTCEHCT